MFRVHIFCGLLFIVNAAPIKDDKDAEIIKFENESDGKGNYRFSYLTSNAIFREESGTVENEGQPDQYIVVRGSIGYKDSEGIVHIIQYQADKDGFDIIPERIVGGGLGPHVVATMLGK